MSTKRRKVRKAAGQTAKRPMPRCAKKQFITRAEARRRAERHVLKRILNRMFKRARVRDGAKARLNIYVPRREWANKDVWVIYKNLEVLALQSSQVVLVCKHTGRVLYEASAGDEG